MIRLLCIFIGGLLACLPGTVSGSALVTQESTSFEIVGVDNRSVAYVSELAEIVVTQCNRYLGHRDVYFPQRVLIALRPKENVNFEGKYQLSVRDQGFVRLDFHWSQELSLEETCFAITQAYLTRYAIYQYGPDAPSKMRAWPIHALTLEAYLHLRPAHLIGVLQTSSERGAIDIRSLLETKFKQGMSSDFSEESYFLLSALRQSISNRKTVQSVVERSLAGYSAIEAIEQSAMGPDPIAEPMTLDSWWQSQRDAIVSIDYDLFERMSDSRKWIVSMTQFDAYREEGGELKNIGDIWALREDPAFRAVIQARDELIKLRMEIVNPAYFNAARSLGALYETALDESTASHRFMHALVNYLGDLEDAKQLEMTTMSLLEDLK
ncbi:MAG: hypothetical protein NWS00_01705 [Opitutales bacterium]|nr:hypothetical protein [Opitutales bacterium]